MRSYIFLAAVAVVAAVSAVVLYVTRAYWDPGIEIRDLAIAGVRVPSGSFVMPADDSHHVIFSTSISWMRVQEFVSRHLERLNYRPDYQVSEGNQRLVFHSTLDEPVIVLEPHIFDDPMSSCACAENCDHVVPGYYRLTIISDLVVPAQAVSY
ncbi:hypothetical protein IT575_15050 [bacterium]|nr:hypothetical protein [bacterium]